MRIQPKLKPLYANLKRLKIGEYLYTKEFDLFTIENNIDEIWESCKMEVNKKSAIIIFGHHNTEDEEEAFLLLMNSWYEQSYDSFGDFITTILLNFAKWHSTKLDFTDIHYDLKTIGLTDKNLLNFAKEARKIRDSKPVKIEEKAINSKKLPKTPSKSKKVFIAHGHDDRARLELYRMIKEELGLQPVVLQEEPNISIETIISKFERLAKECSAALILFTPDDKTAGKSRARQNVILELGYFLGKFSEESSRKIAIIKTGDVEIPSDISGVLYLEYFNNLKEIYYDLRKQFESWGYD